MVYSNLRITTIVAASLHFIQAFVIFGLSYNKNTKVSLKQYYASWPANNTGHIEYVSTSGGSIDLKYLIFSFFLLSALFQGVPSCITKLWKQLIHSIENKGIQPYRWIEYSASASCLLLACAVVDGGIDLHYLILLFFTNAAIMFLGYIQEVYAFMYIEVKDSIRGNAFLFLLPHLVGWLAYIPLWATLLTKFILAWIHSDTPPPTLILLAFVFNVIVFSSFGFVQFVEMMYIYSFPKSRRKYALRAELAYTILSFTAKTLTAWFFYGGVIASSEFAM